MAKSGSGGSFQRGLRAGQRRSRAAAALVLTAALLGSFFVPAALHAVEAASHQQTLSVGRAGTGAGHVWSNPAGIDCGVNCTHSFGTGTSVLLVASAAAGSVFAGWSGDCTGTGSCTVTMNSARFVTAHFNPAPAAHTLSVSKVGNGAGTVVSSPGGINCGATCSAAFAPGTVVTLSAHPVSGSVFAGWSGACTGTGACTVTVNPSHSVTAHFHLASTLRQLTVSRSGSGAGTVTSFPPGINCGSDCFEHYDTGTVVTLSAHPASGSTFGGWSGACTGTGNCVVTMSAARSVTAQFNAIAVVHTLNVTRTGNGSGTVTSSPGGINCGVSCAAGYSPGTVVTLSAHPASGSTFAGWSGACTGLGTCTVTMNSARSVTAHFTLVQAFHVLSVTRTGNGAGTVTSSPGGINCGSACSASYAAGTVVTLSAHPGSGSGFSGWSGACAGLGTCTVTMSTARSVTAHFNLVAPTNLLTVTLRGNGSGTVTSSPAGINCGTDCSEIYPPGTAVTLTAVPAANSGFGGWTGACAGLGNCVVKMDRARDVGAHFFLARGEFLGAAAGAPPATPKPSPTPSISPSPRPTVTATATPTPAPTATPRPRELVRTGINSLPMGTFGSILIVFGLVLVVQSYRRPAAEAGDE